MNKNPLSKQLEPAVCQVKQPTSLFSYVFLSLIGMWLYSYLFGNPRREIEI